MIVPANPAPMMTISAMFAPPPTEPSLALSLRPALWRYEFELLNVSIKISDFRECVQ
jgi:hypothetical protein